MHPQQFGAHVQGKRIGFLNVMFCSFEIVKDGECRYNPASSAATCTGFNTVLLASETELKTAVASIGPISVGIDANHKSFQLYKDGQ